MRSGIYVLLEGGGPLVLYRPVQETRSFDIVGLIKSDEVFTVIRSEVNELTTIATIILPNGDVALAQWWRGKEPKLRRVL